MQQLCAKALRASFLHRVMMFLAVEANVLRLSCNSSRETNPCKYHFLSLLVSIVKDECNSWYDRVGNF